MYASLISAGASQLYDLYKSVTERSGSTSAQKTSFKPSPSDDSEPSPSGGGTGAVTPAPGTGSTLSDALQKLFVDLQAGSSSGASASTSAGSSTDATSTVAGDLQSVFKDLKAVGAHGHHHAGPPPGGDSSSPSSGSASTSAGSATGAASPFQGLASSLLAYARTQSLTAGASTSLTA